MSSLFAKCCCTGDCFWGYSTLGTLGEDYGYCSHDSTERLYLRIPRPSFTTSTVGVWPATPGCCSGDFKVVNSANGANAIIAKYAHFPGESGSRLYNWKWYDPNVCLPSCNDSCWGYESVGFSDAECCDPADTGNKLTTCQSVWYSPHPQGSGDFGARLLSKYQRDLCKGTPVNQIGNPPNSALVASSKQFGDGWRWWENVSDYQTGSGQDRFLKRWWNGSVWTTTSGKRLVETMFVVLHRTKWWKRDFNSLHPNDVDPEEGSWCGDVGAGEPTCGAYASCRTPEYWDYECAGFPIYTWEVYNAPSNVLSEDEKKAMFNAVTNGVGFDHEAMDKLVAHLGCEPKDHERETGETVKRTLVDQNGDETIHYAFSREAGWLHVCHDMDTQDKFPQWSTNTSASCNAFPNSDNCFTAAPIPQETTCQSFAGSGPASCNGYSGCSSVTCLPTFADCDGSNPPTTCALDTAVGDCSGIWFHYNQYCFVLPGVNYLVAYGCCIHNEAFLCVVPDANSICDFITLPFDGPTHPIPPGVSTYQRLRLSNGDPEIDMTECCGGKGTFAPPPPGQIAPYCDRCARPNVPICTDPEDSAFCPQIGTP